MIFVVDDDLSVLGVVQRLFEADGFRVKGFIEATKALESAEAIEPQIIISDILMPIMDGHGFRAAYSARFPDRHTPFVFLSALSDARNVVQGLDQGADDYFTKPINPDVFIAKIKAILRRRPRQLEAVFKGSLEHLSPIELWQFCEKQGLTGEVTITTPGESESTLLFEGGMLVTEDDAEVEDELSQLMDLTEGTFIVRSRPVEFETIRDSQLAPSITGGLKSPKQEPVGRLSRLRSAEGVFEVQTGSEPKSKGNVVSVVSLQGAVVSTHESEAPKELEPEELLWHIESQHSSVEEMVKKDSKELAIKRESEPPPPPDDRDALLQLALERYREKRYDTALRVLEHAMNLFPEDRLLKANAAIVKRKLG